MRSWDYLYFIQTIFLYNHSDHLCLSGPGHLLASWWPLPRSYDHCSYDKVLLLSWFWLCQNGDVVMWFHYFEHYHQKEWLNDWISKLEVIFARFRCERETLWNATVAFFTEQVWGSWLLPCSSIIARQLYVKTKRSTLCLYPNSPREHVISIAHIVFTIILLVRT